MSGVPKRAINVKLSTTSWIATSVAVIVLFLVGGKCTIEGNRQATTRHRIDACNKIKDETIRVRCLVGTTGEGPAPDDVIKKGGGG